MRVDVRTIQNINLIIKLAEPEIFSMVDSPKMLMI